MADKRRIIEFLPEYIQASDQLRKFFNATVDHQFQPEESTKIAGYVGRIPSYFNANTDYYLVEPDSERQFYQLEPAMISKNDEGEIQSSLTYPDLINHLRFQGADTSNHDRLFEQEYYSWSPPIDIDKFLNYSNYYWYPEGPTPINVRGNVSNIINVTNDVLGATSYTSPNNITFTNGMKVSFTGANITPASYVGNTYIVEGVGTGIILVHEDEMDPTEWPLEEDNQEKEFITIARGSQDKNPWSRSNHWYHKDILTFQDLTGTSSTTIIEEEEPVLWDADPWDTTPWDGIITELTPTFNIDSARQAKRPIVEFIRDIELYNFGYLTPRNADLIVTDYTDVFSQIQGQPNGTIQVDGVTLTDGLKLLVINDTNPSVNNRLYEVNVLEVAPSVFEYQLLLDTSGTNGDGSPALNEKYLILSGTAAGSEYYYNGTSFVLSQRKLDNNQAPLFKLFDTEGNYLADTNVYNDSTFMGNRIFSYQVNEDSTVNDEELGFPITYRNFVQLAEIVFENFLETQTYNFENTDSARETIPGYYYYHVLPSAGITEYYNNGWHLAPEPTSQDTDDGFYEIPTNLQANPDNDEITDVTRGQLLAHFRSIIENQINIEGSNFTSTNYRDTAKDLSLGEEILQHRAPLLKTMQLAAKDDIDFMKSVRYNSAEYRRFRNKLLQKIESFIKQGFDGLPYSKWLEDAMSMLNASKSKSFPFTATRMCATTENYESVSYEAIAGDTEFILPGTHTFDPTITENYQAVLVYIDDVLQIVGYDYTVSGDTVTLSTAASGGETVEVRWYENIAGSYIPATASAMGITPIYKPERFTDNTYSTPRNVIQCHDGSIYLEFGDERDDVIFELEKRIYNATYEKFKKDRVIYFDVNKYRPGKFRDNDYTLEEYKEVLTPIFTRWATKSQIRWAENVTYDPTDWKTWNWSNLQDTVDSETLHGSWRAIYFYYYDTDRPHTHPWEMLGFSEKPDWWESYYGAAPYRANNTALWNDLEAGRIQSGTRAGIDETYARPGLTSYIPVNNAGQILSPTDIGIVTDDPGIESAQTDWQVGDWSPAENAFWKSNERSFFIAQIMYLLKPARFIEFNWDTDTIAFSTIDPTQLINTDYDLRAQLADIEISKELTVAEGPLLITTIVNNGIQQWIKNYLESLGRNVEIELTDYIHGLEVQLGWKTAGFVKEQNLRFLADSSSPSSSSGNQRIFIRDEDFDVELYESTSIKESFYGGVIVEWTGTGYAVYGYDVLDPYFTIIPSDTNNKYVTISVADVSVKEYRQGQFDILQEIPYGYEFTSRQELYDFLISYQRFQESDGWVFDQYDTNTNELLNWRYAGKQFLFWSQDDLKDGSFITLSPLANLAKFYSPHGLIQNIEEIFQGAYSLLDRAGTAIHPNDVITQRENEIMEVLPTNEQGIYGIRLNVKEYENIVIFNNITRFNDVIYEPLFNIRQARLKALGTKTLGWTGRIDAPGYILDLVTANDIVPNFEKTVADFRRYHDIENPSENDTITDVARHTIGYQRRDYLDQLLIDRDTQFQFYQGMIKQKGTPNVLQRLLRSTAITTANDVSFLEEWAFRIGTYGALEVRPPFELRLTSSDVKIDPMILRYTRGSRGDLPSDEIIDILPNDQRWLARPEDETTNRFVTRDKNIYYKKDLPNAGYVKLGETNYLADYPNNLLDEEHPAFNAALEERVWVSRDPDNRFGRSSWDVLELIDSGYYALTDNNNNNNITTYTKETFTGDAAETIFNLNNVYDLNDGLVIKIDDTETQDYSISGATQITFNSAPANNTTIDVYYLADHNFADNTIAVFDSEEREVGFVTTTATGYEIEIEEETASFSEIFELASIYIWTTKRYSTFDVDVENASDYRNELVYVDNVNNEGWVVYRSTGTSWRVIREEEPLIDAEKLDDVIVSDDETNRIVKRTTLNDPFKGYIPGLADAEIAFKTEYDPAKYTNGPLADNADYSWTDAYLGRVWWDLSTVRYLYYEMEDINYRYDNWGRIFPESNIDVYEWVRSPVSPENWEDYVETRQTIFDFSTGGTVKDIDTDAGPSWVQREEPDTEGNVRTFYYFWVQNKISVPNFDFRSISIAEVTSVINNPFTYGLPWFAAIRDDSLIVANIAQNLTEATRLSVNFRLTNNELPIHLQWELLRENDDLSVINDRHWNKMRDSLVGYDDLGKIVPDPNLRGKTRYGHFYRPRQTWFEDKLKARRVFIEAVNEMLADIDVVDAISGFDNNLTAEASRSVTETVVDGTQANPSVSAGDQLNINSTTVIFSGLNGFTGIADEINVVMNANNVPVEAEIFYDGTDAYIRLINTEGGNINIVDVLNNPSAAIGIPENNYLGTGPTYTVATRADRDTLVGVAPGDTVYVTADEELRDYWSLWEFTSNFEWELIEIQSYNVNSYWDYADWYADGYENIERIDASYPTLAARNDATHTNGQIVRVDDDGSGNWILTEYNDGIWTNVAKQNGTIAFKETLYNPDIDNFGFDQALFDLRPFDDVPNVEFRYIMDAIRKDLFIEGRVINQNILFFKMVNHVLTEQDLVDWCFKTSYLFIIGFTENLQQESLFRNDGFESLIKYVEEVKPYRTKIKEVVRTFATTFDQVNVDITDYDKPVYTDGSVLDVDDGADEAILQSEDPWIDWYYEYEKDNRPTIPRANNVRKITTKMIFDRTSSVRTDFVPSRSFPDHPDYPDKLAPYPFYDENIDATTSLDHPEWVLLDNYDGTVAPTTNRATITFKPVNYIITVTASGTWSNGSSIVIQEGDESDFSGTNADVLTIEEAGTYTINYNDLSYPFLRANTSAFASGDNITISITATYETALSRLLESYSPAVGMPQLAEVITTYYLGTIVDGTNITLEQGWDGSPWDFIPWDSNVDTVELDQVNIIGGAYFTYEGDDSTDTYNLPPEDMGAAPWTVYVTDTTASPLSPQLLTDGVDYTIDSVANTIELITIDSWSGTGTNLDTGWALTILDSTFDSAAAEQIIIEGNVFTQPNWEGWPEELALLKVADSSAITVVTSGSIDFTLLESATSAISSESITFVNLVPLAFIVSGISGDTVVIEGSNTGDFAGEEVTVATITTNTTEIVTDVYTYYRARVSVYNSGTINVSATLDYAPEANRSRILYDSTTGTGPYDIGINVNETDDLLVTVNGELFATGTDYTVNTTNNTITFSVAQSDNDVIEIFAWNTTDVIDTNPTWYIDTYNGSALDLTNFGGVSQDVLPSPTQPLENSIFVFADDAGSGFKRLTPPEASYHYTDNEQNEFTILEDQFGLSTANITVWLDNVQLTESTDYSHVTGGYTEPEVAINAAGSSYVVGDVLTISGGTGTAATLTVLEVGGSGEVQLVAVTNPGLYSVLPGNPVSVTGGSGAGATFNLTNWSTLSDTIIFLENGTTTGYVSQAAINAAGSGYTAGDTLTVSGGTGTAATLTVLTVGGSGEVTSVAVASEGEYTASPANPVSVTGGTGSSATFDLTFLWAPADNSTIAIRVLGNEDYFITGTDIDFNGVSNGTAIGVMAFKDNDNPMGIQTKVHAGHSDIVNGHYLYQIDNRPNGNDYAFVSVDASGGNLGGLEEDTNTYSIVIGSGWDTEGWDINAGGWDTHTGSVLMLDNAYTSGDTVVVTTLSGTTNLSTLTYREFVGYDDNAAEEYREYIRFSTAYSTTITADVAVGANSIAVDDASIFPEENGVAWINGERIMYLTRTGGAAPGDPGTLTGLVRGSKGTKKNTIHNINDVIRPGDDTQYIPAGQLTMYNESGRRLPNSNTVPANFIKTESGGYKNYT